MGRHGGAHWRYLNGSGPAQEHRQLCGHQRRCKSGLAFRSDDQRMDHLGHLGEGHPTIADTVAVEPQLRIYRDAGTALTMRGKAKASSARFVTFLRSPAGARIFAKWSGSRLNKLTRCKLVRSCDRAIVTPQELLSEASCLTQGDITWFCLQSRRLE